MNRDPIQERGGVNLHAFVLNQSIQVIDFFGLTSIAMPPPWIGNIPSNLDFPLYGDAGTNTVKYESSQDLDIDTGIPLEDLDCDEHGAKYSYLRRGWLSSRWEEGDGVSYDLPEDTIPRLNALARYLSLSIESLRFNSIKKTRYDHYVRYSYDCLCYCRSPGDVRTWRPQRPFSKQLWLPARIERSITTVYSWIQIISPPRVAPHNPPNPRIASI